MGWGPAPAEARDKAERRIAGIKAAYLLNFIRFTQWPDDAFSDRDAPIVIAVLGRDPMGPMLDRTMADRRVHDRPIEVRRYRLPDDREMSRDAYERAMRRLIGALRTSHVLFLAHDLAPRAEALSKQVDHDALLTVGDGDAFVRRRVMLSLIAEDGRIVFSADVKAIEQSPIRVSSQLLRLARIENQD